MPKKNKKKGVRGAKKNSRGKRGKRAGAARGSTAKRGAAGRQFLGHHVGYLFKDYMAARAFAFKALKHMKKGSKMPTVRKVESTKATFDHVVQIPFKSVDPKKFAAIAKEATSKAKKAKGK